MGHLGLKVTRYLRTSVTHIYAAGDAAGNGQLTPVAAYEGRLAAHNALEGDRMPADERIVPQTVFTTPEVAKVGLTRREVEASGIQCHVATQDMRGASNGAPWARTMDTSSWYSRRSTSGCSVSRW